MDAIRFVSRYPLYIEQLEKIIKPEYEPVLSELKERDPHDFISPERYFNSEAEAMGVVLRLLLQTIYNGEKEIAQSAIGVIESLEIFVILSAWQQEASADTNKIAHEQLKAGVTNLGCTYTEVQVHFSNQSSEELQSEKALLVPGSNLYDMMLLAKKYGQTSIISRSAGTIDVLDTDVGRILSSFKIKTLRFADVISAYTQYLQSRHPNQTDIAINSFQVRHIPTRSESLLRLKDRESLSSAVWIDLL